MGLQELDQNVVAIQKVLSSVSFDGKPNAVDHLEHPEDLVSDFACYVRRLFPRHGEGDVVQIILVLGEL